MVRFQKFLLLTLLCGSFGFVQASDDGGVEESKDGDLVIVNPNPCLAPVAPRPLNAAEVAMLAAFPVCKVLTYLRTPLPTKADIDAYLSSIGDENAKAIFSTSLKIAPDFFQLWGELFAPTYGLLPGAPLRPSTKAAIASDIRGRILAALMSRRVAVYQKLKTGGDVYTALRINAQDTKHPHDEIYVYLDASAGDCVFRLVHDSRLGLFSYRRQHDDGKWYTPDLTGATAVTTTPTRGLDLGFDGTPDGARTTMGLCPSSGAGVPLTPGVLPLTVGVFNPVLPWRSSAHILSGTKLTDDNHTKRFVDAGYTPDDFRGLVSLLEVLVKQFPNLAIPNVHLREMRERNEGFWVPVYPLKSRDQPYKFTGRPVLFIALTPEAGEYVVSTVLTPDQVRKRLSAQGWEDRQNVLQMLDNVSFEDIQKYLTADKPALTVALLRRAKREVAKNAERARIKAAEEAQIRVEQERRERAKAEKERRRELEKIRQEQATKRASY